MQALGSLCEALCVPLRINPPLYRRRVDFYTKDRSFNAAKARAELGCAPAQSRQDEIRDILADYRRRGWL
jgi:nucleoside-diphosphate-sugar epimerase